MSDGGNECDQSEPESKADTSDTDPAQVAFPKLFLFLELQGTLMFYEPLIFKGKSAHQRSQIRERPGLREFIQFCMGQDIVIVWWSDLTEGTLRQRLHNIEWKVPEIKEDQG